MLVIRLSRTGRKKNPQYRLVLQEREWSPSSKALEILGFMNPHTDPATVELKSERIQYWISQGAQPSNTVHNMLVTAGVIKGDKKRSVFGKKKVSEDEAKAAEEAKKAEADAKKEADKPAEESKEAEQKVEAPKKEIAEEDTNSEKKEA